MSLSSTPTKKRYSPRVCRTGGEEYIPTGPFQKDCPEHKRVAQLGTRPKPREVPTERRLTAAEIREADILKNACRHLRAAAALLREVGRARASRQLADYADRVEPI